MPGPFPGMDPYLEIPRYWRGLHNVLIGEIAHALNADLPPGFAAYTEERRYVVPPDDEIVPDVFVGQLLPQRSTNAVVAERADPPDTLTLHPRTERELFLEIYAGADPKRIVTFIEVLSPSNKIAGSKGRREYQEKQQQVLQSEIHLLEIDLLRQGAHTLAAPHSRLQERGQWDYLICLHRAGQGTTFHYWMNSVRERLPRILVPLTEGMEDTVLDLQAAFDRAYDAGPYRRDVDYRAEPPLPLAGEDSVWCDALLREKGLRD